MQITLQCFRSFFIFEETLLVRHPRKTKPGSDPDPKKNRILDLSEKPDPNIYTHSKLTNSPILIKFGTIFYVKFFSGIIFNKFGQ